MTRLTDTTPQRQQFLNNGTNSTGVASTPQRNVVRPIENLLPAQVTPETASPNDRLTNARPTTERPTAVAAGLPVAGEPEGTTRQRGTALAGEAWSNVFAGGAQGEETNRLMDRVLKLQAERNNTTRGTDEPKRGLQTSSSALRAGLPAGSLTVAADGSLRTPGGYSVLNDGGHNWRIRTPTGQEHRIWGDPHVDENNDGHDDWHFNKDASFILPDGTKIFCDTSKVGVTGGEDITVSDTLKVQYLDSIGTMDVRNGGPGTVASGGQAYDRLNGDGQVFVLGEQGTFLDGKTLGDLYDAGGDFNADIDASKVGTISDLARITLDGSVAPTRSSSGGVSEVDRHQANRQTGPTLSQAVTEVYLSAGATRARQPSADEDDGTLARIEPRRVSGTAGT